MTIYLSEPYGDRGEFDDEEFVVSGCDAAELLEFVAETLDEIALSAAG